MLSLKEEDLKKRQLENLVISYINKIIEFDVALGRSDKNFFEENFNYITTNIDKIRKDGLRVFIKGGNIFFLKVEHKLTGWVATCLQMRGLAQRKIQIKEDICYGDGKESDCKQ